MIVRLHRLRFRLARPPIFAILTLPLVLYASSAAQPPAAVPASMFVNTLMPEPARLEPKPGVLPIDPSFSYTLHADSGDRISQAATRFISRLERRTGVSLARDPVPTGKPAVLALEIAQASLPDLPQPGEDESYRLDIDQYHVTLTAKTDLGALHGLETLLQLVQPSGSGYVIPAIHIEDTPRFSWRGLMLDPGRHFLPVPVVLRTIDGMAAVKLNVLHWHLTEDQGFRIESRVFPKLADLGSNGQFYTQDQVREVIAYASARGIRIVPEFDMPGHSQSWMVGYPDLGSAPGPPTIADRYGVQDAALDPTRDSTYQFLDAFLGEMAQLFPDPYMHIGGDESNGKEWRANPEIRAFMKAHGIRTTPELQAYFNIRIQQILAKYHKQMVGWDEILSPTLPQDAVIQNWHGIEFLVNAAKQGHRGLLSHPYYLDQFYSAADMFLADPLPPGADLTPEQAELILGGEACMWGEQVIPETIDSRIWPRAAAVAERLWSPAGDRDADDMYRRLAVESVRLEGSGLMHLSGPVRVMRNLAGTTEIQPLELFVATLQPVNFPVRNREQHPSPATLFDRLVDAARFDPPLKHEMPQLVDAALHGNPAAIEDLDALFRSWVHAAPALGALEAGSPLLREDATHIAAWPKLGSMGIGALKYLRSGSAPPPQWRETQLGILRGAVDPHELVEFVVLKPLQALVEGVNAPRKPH